MSSTATSSPNAANVLEPIAEDMQQVNRVIRQRLASEVMLINQISEYIIGAGGKRLRPALLLLDDDTVRTWYRLYEEDGIEGLASFGYEGSACRLSDQQKDQLKAWITETLPRTTCEVGAWIENECGIVYESRSGLIALLHRLGEAGRRFRRRSRWNGQTRDGASQAESSVVQAGP